MATAPTAPTAKRSHLLACIGSSFLHVLLLAAMLFVVNSRTGGTAVQPDRNVGVALVQLDEPERRYVDDGGPLSASNPSPQDATAFLPSEAELSVDVSGDLPAVGAGTGAMRPSDVGSQSAAEATSPGRDRFGESGSTMTSVFGVKGEGTRFVYVFDRSGSMGGHGGAPIAAAKRELLASLRDLQAQNQFQIVFYDDQVELFNPLGGAAKLVWADEASLNLAEAFIGNVGPGGGTDHLKPLNLALDMAPDVIFFLTDADEPPMSRAQLRAVRRRNSGSTVHAIEFGVGPKSSSSNFLSRLATENGGQYRYINIRELTRERN